MATDIDNNRQDYITIGEIVYVEGHGRQRVVDIYTHNTMQRRPVAPGDLWFAWFEPDPTDSTATPALTIRCRRLPFQAAR